jgi:branched-chain amino acid aminotransferase
VKDGRVVTPARGVLEGITRGVTLELAEAQGFATEARAIPLEELLEADEVFLSTTGGGPTPVTEIDGRVFGNGAPGPAATALRAAYWDWMERGPEREPVGAALAAE